MNRVRYILGRTRAHISELGLIYGVQLIFGLAIAAILCNIINRYLGQSVALEQLAIGFDRTVIMDMIYNNDGALGPVTKGASILVPLYLILSIMLQGGLLANIKNGSTSIKKQLKSGVKYFIPFLGIGVLSLIIIALVAIAIGLPFAKLVGDPLVTFSSEKPFVWWMIGFVALFSLLMIVVWGWSVGSRYAYIEDHGFLKSLRIGVGFVRRNFAKLFAVGYLILAIHILLGIIYYLIMGDRGAPSYLMVIFGIVVQQFFAFFRVFVRGLGYVTLEQMEGEYQS